MFSIRTANCAGCFVRFYREIGSRASTYVTLLLPFFDCLLSREAFFNSLVNIPPVHNTEDPNFVFDDPEHHAIITNAQFPIPL